MKQNITPKQLEELSKKGKERLRKWWKPKWWHLFIWTKKGQKGVGGTGGFNPEAEVILISNYIESSKYLKKHKEQGWLLPLLSIGQMLEFLNIRAGQMIPVNNVKDSNEPCYTLWEAVKELLE